jgi:hypothetical protein
MIVVRLLGGLGNQMFQYAAGRALADSLGSELVLDVRGFSSYVLHSFGLTQMGVRATVGNDQSLARFPRWRRRILPFVTRVGFKSSWYTESGEAHDPRFAALPDGTYLQGYFQSEKYFAGRRSQLTVDFAPVTPLDEANRAILEQISTTESVMMHVRRGDYVKDQVTFAKHGICSAEYYQAALDVVRARHDNAHIFLFSNDMQWAVSNIDFGGAITPVDLNGDRPHFDIHLMSHCRHRIIANSSFSWWGAWLGDPRGTTIAPEPWFSDPHLDVSDLYPGDWLRLPR